MGEEQVPISIQVQLETSVTIIQRQSLLAQVLSPAVLHKAPDIMESVRTKQASQAMHEQMVHQLLLRDQALTGEAANCLLSHPLQKRVTCSKLFRFKFLTRLGLTLIVSHLHVQLVDISRKELIVNPAELRLTLLVSHFHVNLVDIGREKLIANRACFPLLGLSECLIRICYR